MPGGISHGVNREYQVTCRDVLIHRQADLAPWRNDGIDVPFEVWGTTWSFDVVLRAPDGSAVVTECRRIEAAVKQEALAAFAYKVEGLRQAIRRRVSAFFFAKTSHQVGAVKVAQHEGIQVAVLTEDAEPPAFSLVFHSYDADREKRLRHHVMHPGTGRFTLTGCDVRLTHRKVDGKSDSR